MIGSEIHSFARLLWSFNRSLTGNGVRQTLDEIKKHLAELEVFQLQQERKFLTGKSQKSGKCGKLM